MESGGSSVSMGDRNASAICWRSVTAVTGLPRVSHCPDAVVSTVLWSPSASFPIVSNFNSVKRTQALLVHAGLFWCCHNERAEMAAVSCGTSHASAVSTPGGYSKMRYKKLFTHVDSHASAVSLLESGE